jgi:hypothetical protein
VFWKDHLDEVIFGTPLAELGRTRRYRPTL